MRVSAINDCEGGAPQRAHLAHKVILTDIVAGVAKFIRACCGTIAIRFTIHAKLYEYAYFFGVADSNYRKPYHYHLVYIMLGHSVLLTMVKWMPPIVARDRTVLRYLEGYQQEK